MQVGAEQYSSEEARAGNSFLNRECISGLERSDRLDRKGREADHALSGPKQGRKQLFQP
jgi:hypothetical protein